MKWSEHPPTVDTWTGLGPRPEILLHPQIPKPLHGLAPRTILGAAWWNETRQAAYLAHRLTCWACGVPKSRALYHRWLEAHEVYDVDHHRGRCVFREVAALCHACHNYIHDGRLLALVEAGLLPEQRWFEVMERGQGVLARAGFKMFKPEPSKDIAAWCDWRLVIGEKEYGPAHATFEDWQLFYERENRKKKLAIGIRFQDSLETA